MRTVSGSRNRTLLLLLGALLVIGGVIFGLLATGAADQVPGAAAWAPGPDAALGSLLGAASQYLLAIGIAAIVVAGLFALWWLLHQIPTKNRTSPYRMADDPEHGVVTVDPGVIAHALEDQLEAMPGIVDAHAELAGTASHPELLIELTFAPRTPVDRVLEQVYGTVVRDLETSLETRLTHVSLKLDADRESAGSAKTSVRGTGAEPQASRERALA